MSPLHVLSMGLGVQTSALLLMALDGALPELPRLDRVIFANTHRESAPTYLNLAALQARCAAAAIAFDVVTAGDLRADTLDAHGQQTRHRQFATMPLFVRNERGKRGRLRRQCTLTYKIEPIRRVLWQLVGRRSRPGAIALWQGISWDESHRMRDSGVRYVANTYPLVERRLTRADCVRWLQSSGYEVPSKSSCIECPLHDNRFWRTMRDERPDEWAQAVEFDRAIRHIPTRIRGDCYLHASLVPLEHARLGAEDTGQLTLEELCGADCGV